ncbi:uncharacterized protein A4U43_C07F20710 [Asparagus officinalis]|uniref:Uncharacterized protein n=1 Tax=Asparagus officinalis TaxID=4686 RepID=A0A5P1EDW7_ASPOF|nr:uncharacterized protein A4U43_C07F20710 [Asparagus officinalis]
MSSSSSTGPIGDKGPQRGLSYSHHDMGLAEEKIAYLQSIVLAERREKEDAFERAHVARLDSKKLKVGLKEEILDVQGGLGILKKDEETDGRSNEDEGENSNDEANSSSSPDQLDSPTPDALGSSCSLVLEPDSTS